jgi:hypothetical protein
VSGFSPEWLALREPADVAARSPAVREACRRYFAGRAGLHVCDLGAGTGASVRALSSLLPKEQSWTLIDNDPVTLAEAKRRHPHVETLMRDFSATPACWPDGVNLITASALLDLASQAWIERFAASLLKARLPVLAMLTVDGRLELTPRQALDEDVFAAFRSHQMRDKGFGPAAGGEASRHLEGALKHHGYNVIVGESPWHVGRTQPELLRQMLEGIAGAVRETGRVPRIDAWLRAALDNATLLTVGHRDVFASPAP